MENGKSLSLQLNQKSNQVQANYNKLSEHVRRLTPQGIQCSVFCGGVNCKYENPENWKADSLAIQGIYSHWVTDDILAMARPSTIVIIQKNIIQQFESLGIKTIINLQSPREHASCGQPLDDSGFSYDPNIFMENNIFYYNFAWKDYGDATLMGLLNMVKVITFAISEGRVAVHCHAGLGRTGVLIACYLVYSLRVDANNAIRYVRLKRPGSVQTKGQIICVRHFAQFILPRIVTYHIKDGKYMTEFTLQKFLRRQKVTLHGYDERNFKNIPKIVHVLCERILKLVGCWIDEFPPTNISYTTNFLTSSMQVNLPRHDSIFSISSIDYLNQNSDYLQSPPAPFSTLSSPNPSENGDAAESEFSELCTLDGEEDDLLLENDCFKELEIKKNFTPDDADEEFEILDSSILLEVLLTDYSKLDNETKRFIQQYQIKINNSQLGWYKLSVETDVRILTVLLFEWLENLQKPLLTIECFENIVVHYKQPDVLLKKLPLDESYLIEYLLRFLGKLTVLGKEEQDDVLKRIIAAISKQSIIIRDELLPSDKGFQKMREGTYQCTMTFFRSLLEMVDSHHNQKTMLPNFEEEDENVQRNNDE